MDKNKQVELREASVVSTFELDGIKEQLSSLLDDNDKKIAAFKTRILKLSFNYGLKDCSPESIIRCGIQALTLNLSLESGQGYVVNYGNVAQFDCGYKGWQVLAKRAGFSVLADVVYNCDEFSQEGFGFDREMAFTPNHRSRNGANDKWAKENLTGVIVSIQEDKTGSKTSTFVPASMIQKIISKSPSMKTDNGKKFSPHELWAEQMFCAKAIKQVITKFPIDLSEAAQLHQAIEFVNTTESAAQQDNERDLYPQERFDENYPAWKEIVLNGTKKALAIITQISSRYKLTSSQFEKLIELKSIEPIEGEVAQEVG